MINLLIIMMTLLLALLGIGVGWRMVSQGGTVVWQIAGILSPAIWIVLLLMVPLIWWLTPWKITVSQIAGSAA